MNDESSKKSTLDIIASSPQFKSFMKKMAVLAGILTIVGLVMKLCGMPESELLLVPGMSSLALTAFFSAWIPSPFEAISHTWKFAMKLTGFSLAVTTMGLLFLIMHWNGSTMMLTVGLSLLGVSIITWCFIFPIIKEEYKKKKNNN